MSCDRPQTRLRNQARRATCLLPLLGAHRPRASDGLEVLLIEPAGTVNTGNAGGELTAVKERL